MSKAKGQSNFKMIKGTKDFIVELREALKESPLGWNIDLRTRIKFLNRQIIHMLDTEMARLEKQFDPEATEKAFQRVNKLQMKMRSLLDQMYPREVVEKDIEEILSILDEISPGARDKIVRKMEKRKSGHS